MGTEEQVCLGLTNVTQPIVIVNKRGDWSTVNTHVYDSEEMSGLRAPTCVPSDWPRPAELYNPQIAPCFAILDRAVCLARARVPPPWLAHWPATWPIILSQNQDRYTSEAKQIIPSQNRDRYVRSEPALWGLILLSWDGAGHLGFAICPAWSTALGCGVGLDDWWGMALPRRITFYVRRYITLLSVNVGFSCRVPLQVVARGLLSGL